MQGEAPREQLLREFREHGDAVLLGTASFWEGVDVQGQALRLVIIDRLPFASPDDPVLRARLQHAREQGDNPFNDIQVPEAALALKQGVGRLIRSETDQGVVAICDPRLHGTRLRTQAAGQPAADAAHARPGRGARFLQALVARRQAARRGALRMKILALDTASAQCSVALLLDGELLVTRAVATAREHAQLLLPMIDAAAGRSGHRAARSWTASPSVAVRAPSPACAWRPA